MHDVARFLEDLAVVLCVAAVTTVVFHRLRQPVVLGYLLAGLLIGPHVPFLGVSDLETVHLFSELGVVLLMFSLGLDFSVRRILQLGRTALVVCAIEVGLLVWLGFLAGRALGWDVRESVFLGALVSISSTMIVAKTLREERIDRRVAELAFGILVVEDLVAILMIASLSTLAAGTELDPLLIAWNATRLLAFLVILVVVGIFFVPRFLDLVVRSGSSEACVVATVGSCFAGALLAQEFGYSPGLGAFLAGALCAESGQARTLEHQIRPLRDTFSAIFFVAVGMLIDPKLILEHLDAVLVLSVVVIVGKTVGVSVGAIAAGHGTQRSVQAGMSMTQIGEFSFLIAALAPALGPRGRMLYPIAVAVSVVTTFTTPYLVRGSRHAAAFVDRRMPRALQTFLSLYGTWLRGLRERARPESDHHRLRRTLAFLLFDVACLVCLVVGTSSFAGSLTAVLHAELGVPEAFGGACVVILAGLFSIPFAIGIFRSIQRSGYLLTLLALPEGESEGERAVRPALVLALQTAIFLAVGLPVLACMQPFVPLFPGITALVFVLGLAGLVLWRRTSHLDHHVRAGVEVIAEILARQSRDRVPLALDQLQALLPGLSDLVPVRLEAASAAVGETLVGLDLRGRTGASVICIVREPHGVLAPSGGEVLQPGDVLVLSGDADSVRTAKTQLARRQVDRPSPEAAGPPVATGLEGSPVPEREGAEDARRAKGAFLERVPSLLRRRRPAGEPGPGSSERGIDPRRADAGQER